MLTNHEMKRARNRYETRCIYPLFANLSFEDMLDKVQRAGLNAVRSEPVGIRNHHCPQMNYWKEEKQQRTG